LCRQFTHDDATWLFQDAERMFFLAGFCRLAQDTAGQENASLRRNYPDAFPAQDQGAWRAPVTVTGTSKSGRAAACAIGPK
jgi:hypothetical protein